MFEDPGKEFSVTDVAALDDGSFVTTTSKLPALAFTHSAIWLRVSLHNPQSWPCERWLTVGDARLEDVQVYVLQNGTWTGMQAGSAYPVKQWTIAERQPRFPVEIAAQDNVQILIRVVSRSLMLINPQLWDDTAFFEQRMDSQLSDGIIWGLVLLILPISLVAGYLLRFRLLIINAFALLFYFPLTAVANGYLFYLPSLLPWSRELVAVLSAISFSIFFIYAFLLFRVRRLPRWLQITFLLYLVLGAFLLLWGAYGDFITTRSYFTYYRYAAHVLIPLTLVVALYKKVKLSWLAWGISALFLAQGTKGLLWEAENDIWLYGEDKLGLSSALIIAFLLISTLNFAIAHTRRRERRALAEIAYLQQAEHERLESQVQLRTQQLRDSLQSRSALLARISHDMRTPLNSIISYAHQLQVGPAQSYPERIERSARQQLEMLDDLLELSRHELLQIEMSLEPGYLFGFLQEIEEEGRYIASRQNNKLVFNLDSNLPLLVHADFRQLRRILINLLNNAAKFTSDGTIVLRITCQEHQNQQFCLDFSVQDNGIGLPHGMRESLLKPFHRGSNVTHTEGFGLGLSIVNELLQQMGSKLVIADGPTGGSIFGFTLWLEGATEEDLDTVFVESHQAFTDGGGRRIVLVDDVELTRTFLGDLLGGYGFEVRLASSAEEALAYLESEPADLLITDQIMPGMNGWALLQEVRARYSDLPVMLYSASPARAERQSAELLFDATLLKPASTTDLLACIERLCAKSTALTV
ncbi:response regulator [Pseudomonas sp. PDM16]|uniref:7TM-DISM domain-containing protein n=1 Tax=Pseudomonas sp. PDM16 TaxID=2769292 RepID=UPI00177EC3BE|nr:7TM-DISM domain-containing protein [Pseudomonas sp. PDM16]MBD9415057.1 response regulator [Pseudomonas sp. PDM16]